MNISDTKIIVDDILCDILSFTPYNDLRIEKEMEASSSSLEEEKMVDALNNKLIKAYSHAELLKSDLECQMSISSIKLKQLELENTDLKTDYEQLLRESALQRNTFQKTLRTLKHSLDNKDIEIGHLNESNSILRSEIMENAGNFIREREKCEKLREEESIIAQSLLENKNHSLQSLQIQLDNLKSKYEKKTKKIKKSHKKSLDSVTVRYSHLENHMKMGPLTLLIFTSMLVQKSDSFNLTAPVPIPEGDSNAPTGDYCLKCKTNLQGLEKVYHKLKHTIQTHTNASCYDVLCRQNDIGIVCSDFKYIQHLWSISKCDYCYINNSMSSDKPKPDVSVYISLVQNVTNCFKSVENWYAWSKDGSYQCRDIYDKYNMTMREWKEVYGCIRESADSYTYPYVLLFSYIVILYFSFYFLVIYILPRQKYFNMQDIKTRTGVLTLNVAIREPRPQENVHELLSHLSIEEINQEVACPCFKTFTKFVKEYRDAREDYRRHDPPDNRVVAAIHKKYLQEIHNSPNFRF
ncbi:unnamed protein product [Lepeophtheirus salmonis]|uniref:(salmon louse) hypothetical protein n=1 Tax=Lepeophtheirus salmonis TaxID=72036 RepID=A0A7R8CT10_LEPSM|nr:unnamed protein product [Lepeophtheirus salmonis]CAF2869261.1 unnamed protein product [Lepeophtheirus salmonis]